MKALAIANATPPRRSLAGGWASGSGIQHLRLSIANLSEYKSVHGPLSLFEFTVERREDTGTLIVDGCEGGTKSICRLRGRVKLIEDA